MPVVLFEDNHTLAVYKPYGWLTQGDQTGDISLLDWVKDYLKTTYHKPGNVFVGLVHRLDRPVAGIVVFAKTSKGASRLSEQFRAHTVTKRYQALVEGSVAAERATLIHFLSKNERTNTVTAYNAPTLGALRCELQYRVLERSASATLVEIELKTGRSHQIRAQFAAIGHPLCGDVKYGATQPFMPRALALVAEHLVFSKVAGEGGVVITLPRFFKMRGKTITVTH